MLNGGGPAVSTSGGEVTLNLGGLLQKVGEKLGVGGNLAEKVPPEAGQITVLTSSQLSNAQSVANLIRRLPIVLTLLVILLYGLAIYFAGPRRREALRSVGICLLVAGAMTLVLRGWVGNEIVAALAKSQSVKPAAEAVWSIGTSLLVTVATSAVAFGILLIIAAWLVGPTRYAVRLRHEAAPHVRENRASAYVLSGLVYLGLVAWAPISAFSTPIGLVLFAILFAFGTEFLCRQILRESEISEGPPVEAETSGAAASP